ncbi:MAG: FAD-binding oxidoreductase [Pseudomonadota bacterium]
MDISGFREAIGEVAVEDDPRVVLQRSRDYYWYSPFLKSKLDHVTADLVVSPRNKEEVKRVLAAAYLHDVPITPRGASTGNYGQAMPLRGGAMLDLREINKVIDIKPDRVRTEAGVFMNKLDDQTKAAVGGEIRFHPSTYRMATIGGFIAGGSGGIGSIRWGGLRNLGNILGLEVITCEAEPRTLDLRGTDVLKVAHAYGTNGIIVEAEMPLAPAHEWVDVIAGFDDIMEACRFAEKIARQDGILLKVIAPVASPVAHDYAARHRDFIRPDQSVVLMMVAPCSLEALLIFLEHNDAELLYRGDKQQETGRGRLPPLYELTWNHTTLRGLKVDPTITYLQTQYPDLAHVEKIIGMLGDEMPMHLEMIRFDGKVTFAGLPIVRYTTEERLEEIIKIHEDNDCLVFNPHRYTLEEGGMKQTDRAQLAFKREADPKGLLNPGKMIAWDDPDFDFSSGRVWLFAGLETQGAA